MPDVDRSLGLRITVAAVLAVLLLVPSSLIAVLVVDNWAPLHDLDLTVTDALHGFAVGHPAWVRAMVVWSIVFAPNSLRLAAAVLVVWLWRRGASSLALWVVLTMTVGGLLGALLKLLVGRHRPDLLEPVARATGYSFPSGHALNSALTAGVFLLVLLPFVKERRWLRAALWAVAACAGWAWGCTGRATWSPAGCWASRWWRRPRRASRPGVDASAGARSRSPARALSRRLRPKGRRRRLRVLRRPCLPSPSSR
jgi:hypothetical protein